MILVIDNYDSFAHNLARYLTLTAFKVEVARNDALSISAIESLNPQAIVISPGPGTPDDAGICIDAIEHFAATTPILGVCLGHQCIANAYGARTVKGEHPTHGRASEITHDGSALFHNITNPTLVGRYHSLIVQLEDEHPLNITAQDKKTGTIMALEHRKYPTYGVQFHPESILTQDGMRIIENFSNIVATWHKDQRL